MSELRSERLSLRVTPTTIARIDRIAQRLSEEVGVRFSTSDVITVCVKEYLDAHPDPPTE